MSKKYFKLGLLISVFLFAGFILVKSANASNQWVSVDNIYQTGGAIYVDWTLLSKNSPMNDTGYGSGGSRAIRVFLNGEMIAVDCSGIGCHSSLNKALDGNYSYPDTLWTSWDCNEHLDDINSYTINNSYTTRFNYATTVLPTDNFTLAFYVQNGIYCSLAGSPFFTDSENYHLGLIPSSISIIQPTQSSTIIQENYPNFWGVEISNSGLSCSSSNYCYFDIYYYPTAETYPIYADTYYLTTTSSDQFIYFPKQQFLDIGSYSAQAYLYSSLSSSTFVATSSIIHFNIATTTIPNPSQGFFMDSILGLKNILFQKIPLGWLNLIIQKLNEISVSSSTPPALFLNINFGQGSTSMPVLNFTSTKQLAGSSGMSLIRTYAEYGIWIGFLIYLISLATSFFSPKVRFHGGEGLD